MCSEPTISVTVARNLQTSLDKVQDLTLRLFAGIEGLCEAKDASPTQIETLWRNLSNLENTDLAKTAMELHMARWGYGATLGVTARLGLPSLADFLR